MQDGIGGWIFRNVKPSYASAAPDKGALIGRNVLMFHLTPDEEVLVGRNVIMFHLTPDEGVLVGRNVIMFHLTPDEGVLVYGRTIDRSNL